MENGKITRNIPKKHGKTDKYDIEDRHNKGEQLTVEITDIGNEGEGIGKVKGYTLFIKDAVIGDTVKATIMKAKKNYAYAHLDSVIEPSEFRQEPFCRVSRQCGGCQLQNMAYERQLKFKEDKVRNNIIRLGNFDSEYINSIMEPVIRMDKPFRYRNKAQFPIGKDKEGNPVCGFYAGHTHTIIPADDCMIGTAENRRIIRTVIDHMKKNHISAYDEASGKGTVRHILIRKGFATNQIMVCLVLNGNTGKSDKSTEYISRQAQLVKELIAVEKNIASISVSINSDMTNIIMGQEIHTIWGADVIYDTLCGLKFCISPLSFYQVNPVQAQKLYDKAIEYAALTGKETVWDLYCGIGTITLAMARSAGAVYGVEVVPEAVADAKHNADINNIENVTFLTGKAEDVITGEYERAADSSESNKQKADVIVVDPPRKGCDDKCLQTMIRMQPKRIVYISCDSATLARDLRILCDGGYELKRICPADLFTWTVHVETVVLMSRVEDK